MPVVMSMHWPEFTKEQYERALKGVRWEQETPKGAMFHVVWFTDDGFHVTDVWRSPEDFQRFSEQRLNPVLATLGVQTQPAVAFGPMHRLFNPGIPMKAAKKAKAAPRARKKVGKAKKAKGKASKRRKAKR